LVNEVEADLSPLPNPRFRISEHVECVCIPPRSCEGGRRSSPPDGPFLSLRRCAFSRHSCCPSLLRTSHISSSCQLFFRPRLLFLPPVFPRRPFARETANPHIPFFPWPPLLPPTVQPGPSFPPPLVFFARLEPQFTSQTRPLPFRYKGDC